ASAKWRPGTGRAIRYSESRAGNVTFAVKAPGGKLYPYRARTKVAAASTLKVMFMTAYLRRFARHRALNDDDRALLAPMIKRSDNYSADRIADRLGPNPMYRLAELAGMKDFSYTRPWGNSTVSARDQARFMFNLEDYLPNRHERYARYLLSHIVKSQRWGIGKVPKPEWKKFFKGGWGSGTGSVCHQIAFITRDGMRISAAVMITSSPSHEYATETLRGVFKRLLRNLPKP
ncbi:MAG: hypothetical protein GEU71_11525, partial [Actinobacteria bacterium]|nr:hypothetical protein [Actinomycetota bacterium]